ncbi:MAG TPA: hypothetical protein DHE23_08390 [Agrobacterium sp.]|nr:hypothetical protein [Agrobacterium sp.]
MAEEDKKVLGATEARQGLLQRPVLVVLVTSLALAVVAWIVAELWGQSTQPATDSGTSPSAINETRNPGAQGGGAFDNNPPSGSKPASEGVDRNPTPTQ